MYNPVKQKFVAVSGRCSWFGGPNDNGVGVDDGLALISPNIAEQQPWRGLFLPSLDVSKGLARQLDPAKLYCAMRWDYHVTPPEKLLWGNVVIESAYGEHVVVKPVDWGPNLNTGRIIDLSPAVFEMLSLKTDDTVSVTIFV